MSVRLIVPSLKHDFVGRLMTFHRVDFQKVLLARLPSSHRIHCSKRLRSYTQRQGGPITLFFEDGTSANCDVLLGADGLKSAVRRSFLGEKAQWAQGEGRWSEAADLTAVIEPSWSGTNAYRALISGDKLKARHPNHRVLTQPTQVSFVVLHCLINIDWWMLYHEVFRKECGTVTATDGRTFSDDWLST